MYDIFPLIEKRGVDRSKRLRMKTPALIAEHPELDEQ
jgi:hypothetical protein